MGEGHEILSLFHIIKSLCCYKTRKLGVHRKDTAIHNRQEARIGAGRHPAASLMSWWQVQYTLGVLCVQHPVYSEVAQHNMGGFHHTLGFKFRLLHFQKPFIFVKFSVTPTLSLWPWRDSQLSRKLWNIRVQKCAMSLSSAKPYIPGIVRMADICHHPPKTWGDVLGKRKV